MSGPNVWKTIADPTRLHGHLGRTMGRALGNAIRIGNKSFGQNLQFFPSYWMAICRPDRKLALGTREVMFKVSMTMNKLDIRQYLKVLYNVDVENVNTYIKAGKHKKKFRFGRDMGAKGPIGYVRGTDSKYAIVTLPHPQRFYYPYHLFPVSVEEDEIFDRTIRHREDKEQYRDILPAVVDYPALQEQPQGQEYDAEKRKDASMKRYWRRPRRNEWELERIKEGMVKDLLTTVPKGYSRMTDDQKNDFIHAIKEHDMEKSRTSLERIAQLEAEGRVEEAKAQERVQESEAEAETAELGQGAKQ
eukprot:Clim_evm22s9 gene=Clim_evmTU22s9